MEALDRVALLQQFGRTYRAFMAGFESSVGLPLPRWRILLKLSEHDGAASQKALVESLKIDPGALTRQVKALEDLGWITRTPDARDNRVLALALTDAGRATLAAHLPRRDAFLDETLRALPDSALEAFSDALSQLEARVAEVTGRTPL